MGDSIQMGLPLTKFVKLHSFLVATEATCSRGDFPVVAVETMLVAVIGLAIAALVAAVPTELAAAVVELPKTAKGAAQLDSKTGQKIRGHTQRVDLLEGDLNLLGFAGNVKNPGSPGAIDYWLKWRVRRFIIGYDFAAAFAT